MSDVTTYRLDAYEKRADVADARMERIEALLMEMRMEMRVGFARLPSKTTLWGMIATVVGIAAALISVFVGVLTYLQTLHR